MSIPLYKEVYIDIKKAIQDSLYPIGTKLPTDSELTKKYGVSNITIKKAMDLLKKDNLIERKPRTGTIVIRNIDINEKAKSGKEFITLGVVVSDFNEYFGNNLIKSIITHSSDTVNCILKFSKGDPKKEGVLINELLEYGVNGIILIPASSDYFSSKLLELISSNFPLVLVDRIMDKLPTCNVTIDNKAAATDLTHHLIDSGHKKIGIITANKKLSTNEERIEGAINAHISRDVQISRSQILSNMESMAPERIVSPEEDVRKIKVFLQNNPDLTAVLAGEYAVALLVKQAIEELGLNITDDYSIVCFDHSSIDLFKKNQFVFDHIHQDEIAIGKEAVNLIVEKVKHPDIIKKIIVPHKLIKGASVKHLEP